ncbi:MAG: efflux RND transporter periplasmic adaptor subunit [Gemmatimonadetes bacterium]|nr:efflux RND transporter periplasmic adaptor subunit [Gemmatimonadota bacterium]
MRHVIPLTLLTVVAACGSAREGGSPNAAGAAGGNAQSQGMGAMPGMAMGEGPIRISARQASLAGVTFAVAREAPVERTVRAVAMAVPNERGLKIVNARVNGWVEVLHAQETGRFARAGDALLELYAPELVTAQEELLLAKRLAATTGGDSLLAAARRRLSLWDVAEDEIVEIERTDTVRRRLTLRSPSSGHILEKNVIEGQMIQAGERLFKIADLSTIWIEPAIFEADIPVVRVGQGAQVTFDALPGHLFNGPLTFVYPELDMRTRTLRLRVEVPNRGLLIKPMMYGAVRIVTTGPRGVVVPLAAVLPTGTRDLAFVVREGGVVPTPVVVGSRGDSTILVADGLAPGDTIVASATFLFDSESQLAAAMAGIMLNMGMGLDMGGMPAGEMEGMEMPGAKKDTAQGRQKRQNDQERQP